MHKTVSSPGRFRKAGLSCSLVAVAAGTTAVMTANAQIQYSGLQDLSVNVTGSSSSPSTQLIDLENSGTDEFALVGYALGGTQDLGRLTNFVSSFKVEDASGGKDGSNASLLAAGVSVGSSSTFSGTSANIVLGTGTPWLTAGSDAFAAFTFNPSGSLPLYGWAQFTRSADGSTLTLVDWAYNTTGAAIQTGQGEPAQTPEPTTLALGLTGVSMAGAGWYHRRRTRNC